MQSVDRKQPWRRRCQGDEIGKHGAGPLSGTDRIGCAGSGILEGRAPVLDPLLRWHTEGRGDRDRAVIEDLDLFQGILRAGSPIFYSFHFKLPEHPWSYAGHYVNIVWEIETSIDLALARDPQATHPFVLAPD